VSGLTGYQLRRMRATADAHLPDSVEVWRSTDSSDSRGGQTQSFTRRSTHRGRYVPLTTVQSAEQVYADRLGGMQGWWFTLPIGSAVGLGDRLVTADRTFEVVSLDAGRSWDLSLRALCRELT
jgi:hypothetical protein